MTFRFRKVSAPSVESMALEQEAMAPRKFVQRGRDYFTESSHVLRVLDYRQPLLLLMRLNSVEPLQHFVAADFNSSPRRECLRQNIAPDRMRVQYRARQPALDHCNMQECFCRCAASAR